MAARRRGRGRSWAARALKALVVLFGGSLLWVLAYRFVPPPVTATMLVGAAQGHGISKDWRSLSRVDPNMARAAIAAEDGRFCAHHGFDADALVAAFEHNERGGRLRGGSTISQQTAKNVFLWQGGGYVRKGLEAYFTTLIELIWGKRRIMEVYLNVAETGIGTYGVEAGAQRYYEHGADRLSPTEAARLAAVLPLPKVRDAADPTGWTRRYAALIARRAEVVRRDRLDACVR